MSYIIVGGKVKRRWWFGYCEVWYVETPFSSIGPFYSYHEADFHRNMLKSIDDDLT